MKRPAQRPSNPELTATQRVQLANAACYKGSGEHKTEGWWGGLPRGRQLPGGRVGRRGRQKTTICPLTTKADRERATDWIRRAIIAGQYRFFQADKRFPKKLWFEADGTIWCGFCLNSEAGQYKGWPISTEERDEIFGRLG